MAVLLVVFAPFLVAALAPALHRVTGAWVGWATAPVPGVSFYLLWQMVGPVAGGGAVPARLNWGGAHGLALSFMVDGLSLMFALAIAGIGTLILIYAGAYLKGHAHQGRFFAFMLMFMGAMQGLVLADSTVVLYGFWELTTVASFLLIGFDHTRQVARRAAIQAVVVTGVGGLALLAGAVLLERLTGSWELSGINASTTDLAAHPAYGLVFALVALAALTKSAQLPFHFWLPNAMEAPTPVSAFLHSATMVQGGVYLLARLSPSLGGSGLWTGTLVVVGGATLLWGGLMAIRQTDLKQMLAQTTVASLGLLVLLLGIGTQAAVMAAAAYFLAHALYKAGLFLVAGGIEHATGVRDITALRGLRGPMFLSFAAAIMGGASMLGVPLLLGFAAKEEMYRSVLGGAASGVVLTAALVVGNALIGGIALAFVARPFLGRAVPTPKPAHEGSPGLLLGPLACGGLAVATGLALSWLGGSIIGPAASAILDDPAHGALHGGVDPAGLPFWLSVLTWGLSAALFLRLDDIRAALNRAATSLGWSFDHGFDTAMLGLIRVSGGLTRLLHHGRMEIYLVTVFAAFALALLVPALLPGRLPALPAPELRFEEWGVVAITAIGVATVVLAHTRLFAILALGVQGLGVALIFLLFGAPELSFTQLMVEILSVVVLALVMTRLKLDHQDSREYEDIVRDGGVALLCGIGVTVVLASLVERGFDTRLGDFFDEKSAAVAHGRNVVNVILVDFRGLDTLGEIAVVMTAGIAILALIRGVRRRAAP